MSMNVLTKIVTQSHPTPEKSKQEMIEDAEKDYKDLLTNKGGFAVDIEASLSEPPSYDDVCGAPSMQQPSSVLTQRQRKLLRRLTTTTVLCVLLLLLLIITISVIGGTYLYRMSPRHESLGWHEIPIYQDDVQKDSQEAALRKATEEAVIQRNREFSPLVMSRPSVEETDFLKEHFEIDPEASPDIEELEVPDFGGSRRGKFLYDFTMNLTAIVDYSGNRCFLMPLNRDQVVPPISLRNMIPGIEHGRYQVNTKRIRETMRVIQTPLDLSQMNLGRYIPGTCKDKLTYRLAKIGGPDQWLSSLLGGPDQWLSSLLGGPDQWLSRKRRSLGTAPRSPIVFREFTGNGVAEFEIYGI